MLSLNGTLNSPGMKTSPTSINYIPEAERKRRRCVICGARGKHRFFDPELAGHVCDKDLTDVLTAEQYLLQTGYTRPE